MTRYLGAHTIDNGGIHMAARRAGGGGMSALQLFTAIPKYYGDKSSIRPERVERFRTALAEVEALKAEGVKVILVDMHCEATSEKNAMGWFLDGKVSAVLGTHTHVQTADARLLTNGTAFITDVGMCGPWDSIIGVKKARFNDKDFGVIAIDTYAVDPNA